MLTMLPQAGVRRVALLFALVAAVPRLSAQTLSTTLIRNAFIMDGSGRAARRGAVRISADRIVGVGTLDVLPEYLAMTVILAAIAGVAMLRYRQTLD